MSSWTFERDTDPRLADLAQQLHARSKRSADTKPLGSANFEVRACSPEVVLEPSALSTILVMLTEFLANLGPDFPLRPGLPGWWSPDLLDLNQVEIDLWGALIAGIDASPGVFADAPDLAASWVATLLVTFDEPAGCRCFRASYVFDVHGNTSITWFIVSPTRVVMVCLVGAD